MLQLLANVQDFIELRQERLHAGRMEMPSLLRLKIFNGFLNRPGVFVRALGRERVEDIGHGHDARRQGDGLAGQAVGIALAVEFFVMAIGDDGAHL